MCGFGIHSFTLSPLNNYVTQSSLSLFCRFTKALTPDDIDLNLSKGIGVLKNLELDAVYISDITNLPPWLEIAYIVCDNIKVEVSPIYHSYLHGIRRVTWNSF